MPNTAWEFLSRYSQSVGCARVHSLALHADNRSIALIQSRFDLYGAHRRKYDRFKNIAGWNCRINRLRRKLLDGDAVLEHGCGPDSAGRSSQAESEVQGPRLPGERGAIEHGHPEPAGRYTSNLIGSVFDKPHCSVRTGGNLPRFTGRCRYGEFAHDPIRGNAADLVDAGRPF